jgi:hypothetical protein
MGAYYCKHNYYLPNGDGTYQERLLAEFKRDMFNLGCAQIQNEILDVVDHTRAVEWAGEVAGYKAGVHEFETKKFLVTRGPTIIAARKGICPKIWNIIEGMLGEVQTRYFLGWLKVARESLSQGVPKPGQILILCGPPNCGKSFTQKLIITPMLGGRNAKCYDYMSGATRFNDDLAAAEHWTLDDEIPLNDPRARKAVGHHFTKVASHDNLRAEAKYMPARSLPQFRRLSVSCNDTEQHIKVLPPLDDLLREKVMLLKVHRFEYNWPKSAENWLAFEDILSSEYEAFAYDLEHHRIAPELCDQRYGIKSYQDPELLEILAGTVRDFEAMELARDAIENCKGGSGFDPYLEHGKDITAEKLYNLIWDTERLRDGLRRLTSSPRGLGRILHRLIDQKTPGLSMRMLDGKSRYTIEPEKE